MTRALPDKWDPVIGQGSATTQKAKRFRIAIAGCGPCGLAAGLLLHAQGHAVTLFERFDEPRPLGSGLMIQPTGHAVLQALGLAERIQAAGSRIDRLLGIAGRRTVLDVRYAALKRPGLFGIGLHRASLFDALYGAVIAAGIPLQTGRTITGSHLQGPHRALTFADGSSAEGFDLVVDALGTWSPLSSAGPKPLPYGALWASLDWPEETAFDPRALAQRYRRASVMAGVLPIGCGDGSHPRAAFFWSLRGDAYTRWQAAGLDAWKAEVLALWPETQPLLDQIVDPTQLTFARYAHRTARRPAEVALIHLGDAWHSASPQLGQGANMALLDAFALAKGLERADTVAAGLQHAVALRRAHMRLYQMLTWALTPVYQSDGRVLPFLRDHLIGPLSRQRMISALQAALVSGLAGSPLRPLGLSCD